MQNYKKENKDFIEIRSELITLEEYLKVCKKIIFKEALGYEIDYEELKSELESSKERFQTIYEHLDNLDNRIRELEWRIENE